MFPAKHDALEILRRRVTHSMLVFVIVDLACATRGSVGAHPRKIRVVSY
jgi:hypothetical protein